MLVFYDFTLGIWMPKAKRCCFAAVCSLNVNQRATCMLLNGVLWARCTATLLMSSDAIAMPATLLTELGKERLPTAVRF